MNIQSPIVPQVAPLSLAGAPSFIERQFPVGRVSAESYKERKAGAGQTLTALGSYWKGRKPLILVRAAILGCLLPATDDPVADLRVFLLLMGMDDTSFARRIKSVRPSDIDTHFRRYSDLIATPEGTPDKPRWRDGLSRETRDQLVSEWLALLPYDQRLAFCFRPEEAEEGVIDPASWSVINGHLHTTATSLPELVEQLGVMRYGRRPKVADTFSGGGSIPFEAARLGCDAYASDLNPVACMLTWGAFNIIGADRQRREEIETAQRQRASELDAWITKMRIEHDEHGRRAKAYLYCLETLCPKTGWMVPMAPSWIISKTKGVAAQLIPDHARKRYHIEIKSDLGSAELALAEAGTVQNGRLVHPMNPEKDGVSIAVLRGDHRINGVNANRLRLWEKSDFQPSPEDVFQERLYCIQWLSEPGQGTSRTKTHFSGVTDGDLKREACVNAIVAANLAEWQAKGFVPDMAIAPGSKTDEPIRTRGWAYWHHLFSPRDLVVFAKLKELSAQSPFAQLLVAKGLDRSSKLGRWNPGAPSKSGHAPTGDKIIQVFDNQALNTNYNYAIRSSHELICYLDRYEGARFDIGSRFTIKSHAASQVGEMCDLYVTDPPYADAVNYHELTEFFIAWLRTSPPPPFDGWTWDSQRSKAVKGSDEKFRSDMVAAYSAMAERMPKNGMQVVMFTHQDAGVWSDLAAIMWAAGLRVTAAWNIVTETESALKEGNYVQGTILLVLRKRLEAGNIKRMDIEGEIEEAVDHQLAALHALDEDWTSERLYTDGDLQLAAYAAALRVITGYATIDRKEVGADVYRKLAKGEKTVIRELIEYAASVANNKLVPESFPPAMWRDLDAPSRFYVRMLDMESKGTTKFADYQDFARTFSVVEYADLMDSTKANAASLAGAGALKGRILSGKGFASSPLRRVLFAIYKTMQKDDPREGLAFLKTELGQDYWLSRAKLVALAKYVSTKTARTRPAESSAADLLAQRLEVDKV